MRRVSRSVLALSVASLVMGSLSACSAGTPDPQGSADALVAALNSGDFSAVALADTETSTANKTFETAFGPLGKISHQHTLSSVATDEAEQNGVKTATATIHSTWDVDDSDADLSYDTQAVWEFDGDAKQWKLRFDPSILAPELTDGDYLNASFTAAARGEILGSNGKALVTNRPVVRVGIDKTRAAADEWDSSARALAKLMDIDPDAFATRVKNSGEKAWVEAIVIRDDADRTVTDEQIKAIPGAVGQASELPLAPTRTFARPLLGSVGEATAEIIEKSEGKIHAGDEVGLSGLQASYNDTLSGTTGTTVSRFNSQHEVVAELLATKPVAGSDVELTLDESLQKTADKLLDEAESNSAIVAIRPSDGAVLAVSSGPSAQGLNTALQGKYAPGSVFKVISSLAEIRDGLNPNDTVKCPASATIDGKTFKNYDGYPAAKLGSIKFSEAVAQSCNTFFVNSGEKLGAPAVAEAAAALGLTGEDSTGVGALMGSVPTDSKGTELAANMIGQGVVEASVLGMATVASSVQAGHTVQPQLVVSPKPKVAAQPTSELTADEAKKLSSMMAQVVDHGTLKALNDLPGETVIGKSGTAEYDSERNAHAWAIVAQGDLAVAVFVEDGNGGAQTAGPLAKAMLKSVAK